MTPEQKIDVDLLAQAILWVQAKEWERDQAIEMARRVAERVKRNRAIHARTLKSKNSKKSKQ